MEGSRFSVEVFRPHHIPGVMAIEERSIAPPWTERAFAAEFEAAGSRSWILLAGTKLAGYIITRVVNDEAELMRIAIAPGDRRRGYGTFLLSHALSALSMESVKTIYLEVRSSNTPAQRFYERNRFEIAGNRPRYFTDPEEDAIILRRRME